MDTPPLLSPLITAGSPSCALAAPHQLHTHKAHEQGFAGWRPQGAATTPGQLTPCKEQGVTHKPSGKPHSNTAQSKATRRAGEWVIEHPCPAAVQLHTLQLGKGGKWGPQLKPHQQQPLVLSSHRNALIPVAQGHGQALSSPGMGCLSLQNSPLDWAHLRLCRSPCTQRLPATASSFCLEVLHLLCWAEGKE